MALKQTLEAFKTELSSLGKRIINNDPHLAQENRTPANNTLCAHLDSLVITMRRELKDARLDTDNTVKRYLRAIEVGINDLDKSLPKISADKAAVTQAKDSIFGVLCQLSELEIVKKHL
jgi:hypothetical protein